MSYNNSRVGCSSVPGPSYEPPPPTIDFMNLVNENNAIKIIKNNTHENDLDDLVNLTLDDEIKQWLNSIQHLWNLWKKSPNTINAIQKFFDNSINPFINSLKLLQNYRGRSADCKNNTLPYLTIEELKKWSNVHREKTSETLNLDIKRAAFHIAKDKNNIDFIKLMAETFQIKENDINYQMDDILKQKQYNIALNIIIAFNLTVDNVVDVLLFPLILQNKSPLVDEYLKAFPDDALILVEFLDSFLANGYSFKDQIYNYLAAKQIAISQMKWDRIHYKAFGKLISRICNKHHISLTVCTNLTNQRAVGGLRYLIHQKYNNNISDSAWNDMVLDAINENPQLVKELITLVDHYNTKDACKWVQYFNYPEDLCTENIRLYMKLYMKDEIEDQDFSAPSTSQIIKYHALPSSVNVIFIDAPQLFIEAVNSIANEFIIGIDSEWKPSFGIKKSMVSLIQIATKTKIFLFDALKLNDDQYIHLWGLLSKSVFENPNIIKLGFGVENDMREIKSSISELKLLKYKDFNFVELQTLWKAVMHAGIKLPHKKENSGEGLSAIVQECFGLLLKKHEQCSNWEIRPLRQSQIDYAALDAYVLLQIYDLFDELSQKSNMNIEDICNRVRENAEKARMKKSKKKTNEKYLNCNRGPNDTPVMAGNTRLLLESCLGTLTRYLRCSGIDVEIMNQNDTWEHNVLKAAKEHRYIVIKYVNSKRVSKLLPRNKVYCLESCLMEEQFKEVCNYFNIIISKDSLFSRCDNCNNNDMTVISQTTMSRMKMSAINNKIPQSTTNQISNIQHASNLQQYSYNDADDEDAVDCGGFLSDEEGDLDELTLSVSDVVLTSENVDINRCLTKFRVAIQIDNITDEIINCNKEFHICHPCGKSFYLNGYFPDNLLNVILYMMPDNS